MKVDSYGAGWGSKVISWERISRDAGWKRISRYVGVGRDIDRSGIN